MKLKTLLINLVIISVGFAVIPAQAGDNKHDKNGWGGLTKVKDRGEGRHREDDDDDHRRKRQQRDSRDNEAGFGNFGGYNQHAIPRDYRANNFKERLYNQRRKEREENQKLSPDSQ